VRIDGMRRLIIDPIAGFSPAFRTSLIPSGLAMPLRRIIPYNTRTGGVMKKGYMQLILISLVTALAASPLLAQGTSTWVYFGPDNLLHYRTDEQGSQIMDFSYAGYQGGGVRLPVVPVAAAIRAVDGDNTANIQAAIDQVSQLSPDSNGFRGAALLQPGTYDVAGTVSITTSGVVLRGSGSGPDETIINLTGDPHRFLEIRGSGTWQTVGSSASITDPYVPSGANSFNVDDASSFSVGDTVLISRPVTAAWVHFMGMDTLVRNGQPQTWLSVGSSIKTDRVITAISGNQITLDVPLTDSFDSQFLNPPGGTMTKYAFPGRISQVGVEGLSVTAPAVNDPITSPQYTVLLMNAVIDGWAKDIAVQDTQNSILADSGAKQVTFDNISVTHTVLHTGDGMADFTVNGTQVFVNRCSSNGPGGSWPFVTQSRVTGPIAILNFTSDQPSGISPHQRWATGLLADNAQLPNSPKGTPGIAFSNRGTAGSGHGWDAGWSVAWNVSSPFLLVQQPPGTQNWCIACQGSVVTKAMPGGDGTPLPNGIYDSLGTPVVPASLYLEQLRERLGDGALANIGYGDFTLSATPRSQTVTVGGSASYTVTMTPSDGFGATVALSTSGLPTGATASFDPASVSGGPGSSTLSVSTSCRTLTGTYTLTITGTSGSLSRSATVTLTVNPQQATFKVKTLERPRMEARRTSEEDGPWLTHGLATAPYHTAADHNTLLIAALRHGRSNEEDQCSSNPLHCSYFFRRAAWQASLPRRSPAPLSARSWILTEP
jgi:hypothetical protein